MFAVQVEPGMRLLAFDFGQTVCATAEGIGACVAPYPVSVLHESIAHAPHRNLLSAAHRTQQTAALPHMAIACMIGWRVMKRNRVLGPSSRTLPSSSTSSSSSSSSPASFCADAPCWHQTRVRLGSSQRAERR
eukprot:1733686-Rhodomonas_salina.3